MHTAQKLEVFGMSIRGHEHTKNQDHFAIATLNKSMRLHQSNLTIDDRSRVDGHSQGHLFLVADGISAGPAPARASGTAVDSIVHYFLNEMPWYHLADGEAEDVKLALEDALHNAQDEILRSISPGNPGSGATLTLAFVFWPDLYIAHVGDSRCYLHRGRELRQLTTDQAQSVVDSSVVWKKTGRRELELRPEVRHERLASGDVLALVTDGVVRETSPEALRSALSLDVSAEEACGRIVRGSGADDRTAIVVRFLPLAAHRSASEPIPPTRLETHRKRARPVREIAPNRPRKPIERLAPARERRFPGARRFRA